MMKRFVTLLIITAAALSAPFTGLAQEQLVPLRSNPNLIYSDLKPSAETLPTRQNPALRVMAGSLPIPFKEDFSYAPTRNYPDAGLWADSAVFVNSGYPMNPPSIGVATFDGLNKYGYPYDPNLTSNTISKPADKLTSQPINLRTSGSQTLQPSDSVALSFYYQSAGYGEVPQINDSLALDLYAPIEDKWYNAIWSKRRSGNSNLAKGDTTFTRAFIWIDSTKFLQDGFRFRFRNAATTTGNFDHWHVDYIYLDKNRSLLADTVLNDISFLYVPTPLLRDYSAMPYEQYNANEMAPKMQVKIKNNFPTLPGQNMNYRYTIDDPNTQLSFYDGFAYVLPAMKVSTYTPHSNPPVNYTFAPLPDSSDFKVTHIISRSSSAADFMPRNDTVIQTQRFRNYYAFDDGSVEAGYYVNKPQARIAYKINVNVTDSFLGMRIYFDPVGQINKSEGSAGFRICVWGTAGNMPGALMYRDTIFKPKYYNKEPSYAFAEYKLIRPKQLSPGTYYIGIQQLADVMTFGFDRNYDHRSSLFYDMGPGWTQSTIGGSVMMRPIFGKTLPPPVGIGEESLDTAQPVLIYPNPASSELMLRYTGSEPLRYSLVNSMGQTLSEGTVSGQEAQINTAGFAEGLYILVLSANGRLVQQQKIIIRR